MNAAERANLLRKARDGIALVFWGTIGAVILLVMFFLAARWFFREAGKRDKLELTAIFEQVMADGTVPDVADEKFTITQRHIGTPFYTIWFTNRSGQRTGYFVSEEIYRKGVWEFKELPPERNLPQKVFYRKRTGEH